MSLLIALDDDEARALVAFRESQLRLAEANLADLKAWTRKEDVDASRARVMACRARLHYAEIEVQRLTNVSNPSAVSKVDLDAAEQRHEVNQADLSVAEAELARNLAGPTETALKRAEAQVVEAQAELEMARTGLERRNIRSPVDGTILYVHMRIGEAINLQNPMPVVSVAESGNLRVRADVDEADIGRVYAGQPVEVTAEQ